MKRLSLVDFSGGMVNAIDPQQMPDNACVEMINYEYTDSPTPSKRKGTDPHPLNWIAQPDTRAVCTWYPRYRPLNCIDDKIYVIVCGSELSIAYRGALSSDYEGDTYPEPEQDLDNPTIVWVRQVLFTDINEVNQVSLFQTYRRVIISDGANNGRYISINKDGDIEYGILGIPAPRIAPTISAAGDENTYAKYDATDIGMGIEKGSILQYCYTVEDMYGSESNPSPISTATNMMYKHPDADSTTGFTYYWYKATVKGMSIDQYSQAEREQLKYINLYRRAIDYKEGVIGTQFQLVQRIPITTQSSVQTSDSSSEAIADISYDKHICPAAKSMIEVNGIVFLSGAKSRADLFPFQFDHYTKITLNNQNGTDYVSPVIPISLSTVDNGIDSWLPYLSEPNRMRMFFSDLTTPIPVVYRQVGNTLQCYISPPHLDGDTATTIYLCFADTSEGITDTAWNDYRYGKFCNISSWSLQRVFDINRPLSTNHLICTNVPLDFNGITDRSYFYNLANMDEGAGELSTGTYNQATLPYYAYPHGTARQLIARGYNIPYDGLTYITYQLFEIPSLPLAIILQGDVMPSQGVIGADPYDYLFACGDMYFAAAYRSSLGITQIMIKGGTATTWTVIHEFDHQLGAFPINAMVYFSASRIYLVGTIDGQFVSVSTPVGIAINLADTAMLYKIRSSAGDYYGQSSTITRFDMLQMPVLNADEVVRYGVHATAGLTYFHEPLGGTVSASGVRSDFANANITFKHEKVKHENLRHQLMWSDIGGNVFPALNVKSFNEAIIGIIEAPSFLKMQYQNTIIAMTRNSVTRIPLSNDLSTMGADAGNVIKEHTSNGLLAVNTLIMGGDTLYWLSESGVMRWSSEGMQNISKGRIAIPIHSDYIALWVDSNQQYLLHDTASRISYVYHALYGVWTRFTNLSIDSYTKMFMGDDIGNAALILSDNTYSTYPGTDTAEATFTIKTKQFYIANMRPLRYRIMYDRNDPPTACTALTYNRFSDVIQSIKSNPGRLQWITTPNGYWGEYMQFSLDGCGGLTRIDVDITEEV